ncbi:YifB family Mg chelatase-like AAA ATPase [Nocardioides mesophilus]|uniref:YifB family Mg chelatase-like AAA ATPase n=1 Tax=Nocardioides mesophilus TaxID=433659 RepID=A0A7G9R963_9ACTN|nr:YifB family Mg chelatase-like AAA ATPase [Nocardioides mesophilus]QNN52138.1 YifB family Mg chelatase-like AAA ATPase [Nocardioides mesophilus]
MSFATARTITLDGADGHLVDVQVDLAQGVVKTALVGRPDAAITEARDRCRAAVINSRFEWPSTRRVTILLSPADLPKRGSHFDLAIAVAVIAAHEKRAKLKAALEGVVFLAELTLDGRLRAVPGVLPMTMAARSRGITRVVVPEPQREEAALVPGVDAVGARSLAQVVALLSGEPLPTAAPVEPLATKRLLSWRGDRRTEDLDMADVLGMADARYALEVAAGGGHHLLLSGPKGAGKTTLAERLPGLLPDLPLEEALELTAVYSLAGGLPPGQALLTRPPFRAPHHSATRASVLGGGKGRVHPGEISRAHHGALFLDEFPLFTSDIVEGLREPLESGEVTIARGEEAATFPARAMVVLACNPCPCGDYHPQNPEHHCTCSEVARREYRRKLTGPVIDRIDITRHIEPVRPHELADPLASPEPSEAIRARVAAARARQRERYDGTPWRLNADVPGPALRATWPLTSPAAALLDAQVRDGRLTRRGATRVHRLAWTVSDLSAASRPDLDEVETALRLRSGAPLLLASLPSGASA